MKETESCSEILKTLADTTRLAVMLNLLEGPACAGELQENLGLEQSLLSHHLHKLKKNGLVKTRRLGRHIEYSLSNVAVKSRNQLEINLGCCRLKFD